MIMLKMGGLGSTENEEREKNENETHSLRRAAAGECFFFTSRPCVHQSARDLIAKSSLCQLKKQLASRKCPDYGSHYLLLLLLRMLQL
jgi:hypothetical protein